MKAVVNNHEFLFRGHGYGDEANGVCEMEFESTGFPEGFDPVSCPNICNAPTTSCFAEPLGAFRGLLSLTDRLSVSPPRIGRIVDATGAELLKLEVRSELRLHHGRLSVENVMTGFSRLPAIERNLVPITDHLLPAGRGEATGVIHFKLLAKTGEVLHGNTVVPYRFPGGKALPSVFVRKIHAMNVEWDSCNRVWARVQSSWEPVTAAAEHDVGLVIES
jgi:hypothetical protein